MLQYISNKGGGDPVDLETAILDGYATDGGLYVPEYLPKISADQLAKWKSLSYPALAFEILSLFIDRAAISAEELRQIIQRSYQTFEKEEVIPIKELESRPETYIMELFYGSTLSFKDVGLSFLINLVDFFLQRKKKRLSIIVATTGDTGPAAASYIAGKSTLDAWVLYPKGLITEEQERQMTTLTQQNVHPVGVYHCPDGGDDLDLVISQLYANQGFKEKVNLSSVNSLNWGRIMIQTVHYFYGYLQVVDEVGDDLSMVVPSGGFGNLCAGGIARKMGLPVKQLVIANNKNACLHRIFSVGRFSKAPLHETVSSAIDILIPINFWRYLYFCVNGDTARIKQWTEEFDRSGSVQFDQEIHQAYSDGYLSMSISDDMTISTIKDVYESEQYLLDPHTAVSVAVANSLTGQLAHHKVICLSTAHPAKFPGIIQRALGSKMLPEDATHPSIETAKRRCQKGYTADLAHLEEALLHSMSAHWEENEIRTTED